MSPLQLDSGSSRMLTLSRFGKSSYETSQSIAKEKEYLRQFVNIVDDNTDAEIIVVHSKLRVDENILQHCPSCKYVITTTSGYDHLDTPLLRKQGIIPIRMPMLRRDTVVETTLGLIFLATRRIQELKRAGEVEGWVRQDLPNYDLLQFKNLTIGVVGSSGVIGSRMVQVLRHLGCNNIISCDTKDPQSTHFDQLAKACDVITLHCDLNPSSYHICNSLFFEEKIKRGLILINTARGGLIDEVAATKAIEYKKLSFLGLDVFEKEPFENIAIQNKYKNICYLPHAAGFSNHLLTDIAISLGEICNVISTKGSIPFTITN